ncbi:NYN domain-containing protein [Cognatishimia activa]|uniref:NYN domain-containing protein n=1 Tax=Cognatishimia activa TaxID=1715691 RepID=A0A975I8A3_9RHOB|nr:NYN domain-containing protein [Cognatishimia activa]QTN36804.1 NYN domain-containing protein [Cognatishimia activa]
MTGFAFIDADNIYRALCDKLSQAGVPESCIPKIRINNLFREYARSYVYYARKDDEELPDWVVDLQRSSGFILRLSKTTQKGKQTKQQGVDVHLAIEAIQHSYRGTMTKCGLFSGDGDFLPLIDALTNNGTIVQVHSFGNPEKGTVAPELRNRADNYIRLDRAAILSCIPVEENSVQPKSISNQPFITPDATTAVFELEGAKLPIWKVDHLFGSSFVFELRSVVAAFNQATYRFKSVEEAIIFYLMSPSYVRRNIFVLP